MQGRHRRSACCRAAEDEQEVSTPGKVSRPVLEPGVEKRNDSPSLGVMSVRLVVLMAVARGAGPGQFSQGVTCPTCTRLNMLADERGTGIAGGMPTVFA